MKVIQEITIIWLIGCGLAWLILKLTMFLNKSTNKGDGKLGAPAMTMGVTASWFVVLYFIILLIKLGTESKKARKAMNTPPPFVHRMNNAEMIKQTIDDYWVNAVQFDDFDPEPSLPIKGSTLCQEYHHSKFPVQDRCITCPVYKAQFGCEEQGFWSMYALPNISAKERREAAVRMAKLFESLYKEESFGRK